MANVMMPGKKQDDSMGKMLTIGGAVAGGMLGGPAGIAAGASLGQTAGGLTASAPPTQTGSAGSTAMQRRAQSMQELNQLRQSQDALAYLPPQQQQQYAPAIQQAQKMANKQYGVG